MNLVSEAMLRQALGVNQKTLVRMRQRGEIVPTAKAAGIFLYSPPEALRQIINSRRADSVRDKARTLKKRLEEN